MNIIDTINIENTTFCGADCIMCQRHNFKFPPEIMSKELFKKCLEQVVNIGVKQVGITGFGDPLMDKYFIWRMKYIKENYPQIKISLTSTCQLLKDEVADAVVKYADELLISMYGFSKIAYESVHRGSLLYENVKENIDKFLERDKRPFVVMKYLLLDENKNDMDAWKNYYLTKADRIDIWKPHNFGDGLCETLSSANGDKSKFVGCFRIRSLNDLMFRTNGDISVCCMDYNHNIVIGNINQTSLKDILNSNKVLKLQYLNNDESICNYEYCKNCDQLYDRSEALVYTSNDKMRVGQRSSFIK